MRTGGTMRRPMRRSTAGRRCAYAWGKRHIILRSGAARICQGLPAITRWAAPTALRSPVRARPTCAEVFSAAGSRAQGLKLRAGAGAGGGTECPSPRGQLEELLQGGGIPTSGWKHSRFPGVGIEGQIAMNEGGDRRELRKRPDDRAGPLGSRIAFDRLVRLGPDRARPVGHLVDRRAPVLDRLRGGMQCFGQLHRLGPCHPFWA